MVGIIREEAGEMHKAQGRTDNDTALAIMQDSNAGRHESSWKVCNQVMTAVRRISHRLDLWHRSRKIATRLAADSKIKGCEDLSPWINAIRNHLWWSAKVCNGDVILLKVL